MCGALTDLITRMATPERAYVDSDASPLPGKHTERRKPLQVPSIVEELAEYLKNEQDKRRRKAAYFILGKLGQKVRSSDCALILLSHVDSENNKYVLSTLLDALGGISKPRNVDLSPIFRRLQDGRWLVRYAAIRALRRTASQEAEDQLLELLEKTNDPDDITYCQETLNEIGNAKAI